MTSSRIQLQTAFVLDEQGRILGTREPGATPGPLFSLVRGRDDYAWAARADLPQDVVDQLEQLAREEPQSVDPRAAPASARHYLALLADRIRATGENAVSSGPAFDFPDTLPRPMKTAVIDDERLLARHFRG
jgi:hypothetical protein